MRSIRFYVTNIQGKVYPKTGHKGRKGEHSYSTTLVNIRTTCEWVVNVTPRSQHLGSSGRVRKISCPPEFDPRTVLPVASPYTYK